MKAKREFKKAKQYRDKNLFDNCQYHHAKEARLHDRVSQLEQERSVFLKCMDRLETENLSQKGKIEELTAQIEADRILNNGVKFSLLNIVDHCKQRQSFEEVKPIIAMLYRFLRCIGTEADYVLIDSIETEHRQREAGIHINTSQVNIKDAHVNGAMYQVTDNDQVNLGGL